MCLHAYGVDHGVRPSAVGQPTQCLGHIVVIAEIDGLDTVAAREFEALVDEIDPEHLAGTAERCDATAHLTDRAESEHRHRATPLVWDCCVLDRLPGGG